MRLHPRIAMRPSISLVPGLRSTIPERRILRKRSNQDHDHRNRDRPSAPDFGAGQIGPVPRTGLHADRRWPASASLPPAARSEQVRTSRSPRSGLSTCHSWSLRQPQPRRPGGALRVSTQGPQNIHCGVSITWFLRGTGIGRPAQSLMPRRKQPGLPGLLCRVKWRLR